MVWCVRCGSVVRRGLWVVCGCCVCRRCFCGPSGVVGGVWVLCLLSVVLLSVRGCGCGLGVVSVVGGAVVRPGLWVGFGCCVCGLWCCCPSGAVVGVVVLCLLLLVLLSVRGCGCGLGGVSRA